VTVPRCGTISFVYRVGRAGRVRFDGRGRWLGAAVFASIALILVMASLNDAYPLWARVLGFAAAAGVLAVAVRRLAPPIEVDSDQVLVRRLFSTQRLPRADIAHIRVNDVTVGRFPASVLSIETRDGRVHGTAYSTPMPRPGKNDKDVARQDAQELRRLVGGNQ
jgi:hypothetical protein